MNQPRASAQLALQAVLALLLVLAPALGACGDSASSGGALDVGGDARQDVAADTLREDVASSDAPPLDSASPEDVPGDAPEDAPSDTPEDAAPDAPEDVPGDAPEDVAPDAPEDVPGDAPEDAPEDAAPDAPEDSSPPEVAIRVMAANITSGNAQSYDPGHGVRIFQGLTPDVTLIQEFSYGNNSDRDIRAFVDEAFGESFHYYREPDSDLPNGVVSRWPILSAGVWEDDEAPNREFAWAQIDIPGPIDLWAVSLHLLTRSAPTRDSEAAQLVGYIEAMVPAEDFLVVGGDLNTDDAREDALVTLDRVVSFRHTPVDRDGNPNTNASRAKPYDWVLADDDLNAYHAPLLIGDQSFPDGLVFDSRVFTPLDLVAPVRFEDSDAPQMQHMAVIKRFVVPGDP